MIQIRGYPELVMAGKTLQRHIVIMCHLNKRAETLSELRIHLDGLEVLAMNTLHLLCASDGRYHALELTGLYQLPLDHLPLHYCTLHHYTITKIPSPPLHHVDHYTPNTLHIHNYYIALLIPSLYQYTTT
jgi:hypothetical protein